MGFNFTCRIIGLEWEEKRDGRNCKGLFQVTQELTSKTDSRVGLTLAPGQSKCGALLGNIKFRL
jgi:hypothetical protein